MPNHPPYYKPHPALPRVRTPDSRASAPDRGYDHDWVKLRAWHIARQPLCVRCKRPGEIVDHIIPISENPALRLRADNLQTLCRVCHGVKTAADLRKERR